MHIFLIAVVMVSTYMREPQPSGLSVTEMPSMDACRAVQAQAATLGAKTTCIQTN